MTVLVSADDFALRHMSHVNQKCLITHFRRYVFPHQKCLFIFIFVGKLLPYILHSYFYVEFCKALKICKVCKLFF